MTLLSEVIEIPWCLLLGTEPGVEVFGALADGVAETPAAL